MKKLIYLSLFALLAMACPKPKTATDLLSGSWEMTSYVVFSPERPTFEKEDVVWTFDPALRQVRIENKIHDQYPFIQESGSYEYVLMDGQKVSVLGQLYDYRMEEGQLILSDKPELDGPMMTFNKLK